MTVLVDSPLWPLRRDVVNPPPPELLLTGEVWSILRRDALDAVWPPPHPMWISYLAVDAGLYDPGSLLRMTIAGEDWVYRVDGYRAAPHVLVLARPD